ncbi:acetyl-CoA synthetase [Pseudogulbenkiania sp. NH8B]|uniref:acyl-CoA synthetase n=1 Tax=Pseudogulbenkiania sp. (strain NH8B) TaxID=748280 RepID=UPI0002279C98|nr:acyl-CoA synthetase [Pseudogulbenkiania sp. NH8B]BAK77014.1 acetyl-CoA synthetase [Pseudogulbenkiania sp. NH8B]
MQDYSAAVSQFDYQETVRQVLTGNLEAINACIECCDRYAGTGRIALYYESSDGSSASYTFSQLKEYSARFANWLQAQGVRPGDTVAGLLPRTVELLITVLGTWRLGAVYQPLFTAFGPKAIEHRVGTSGARVVVTNGANRTKLDTLEGGLLVLTVGAGEQGDNDFWNALLNQLPEFEPVLRRGDDPFLLMFTSGTTGLAKPIEVPLKAIVAFVTYMRDAIGLTGQDRFWNLADPGWAYGLYYAVTGPLAMGLPTTFYDGPFSVESTCRIIRKRGITNLAGSPTAYRLLIAGGEAAARPLRGILRVVSSAGEPLNPEVIRWFDETLGVPIHDHYGQTELGMVVGNHHALSHPVHPGSAGFAMPGYRVVVLDQEQRELPAGQPGILAIDRAQSPLCWFGGYRDMPTSAFVGDYYLSGDTVEANPDGSISFVGRADDVITTSGYRVGPFDVESALIEHPAVIEAAVIGKPDAERTELIKAFVVLGGTCAATPELATELQLHVRQRLATHVYPREIEFVAELPKTPSGKLQRFILRNQEVAKGNADKSPQSTRVS